MMRAAACALACLVGMASAAERARSPAANHYAMRYHWGSPWGGPLEAMLGGLVHLDASSSQPGGYASRLYDGHVGTLEDPTGTFLVFDDSHAAIRVDVPAWRDVEAFSFYVLESARASKASARVTFTGIDRAQRELPLARRIVATRGAVAHVEYRTTGLEAALSNGQFSLVYDNPDFSSAFIAEVVLDDLASITPPAPGGPAASQLLFWRRVEAAGGLRLHSLMVRTGRTGVKERDVTPAWLAVPRAHDGSAVPLLILVQDSSAPDAALELMGLAGRPEWALAPAFAQAGFAALVIDAPTVDARAGVADYVGRVRGVLEQLTKSSFARQAGIDIDATRIGVWSYGNGAGAALAVAAADAGRRRAGLSHPPRREAAIPADLKALVLARADAAAQWEAAASPNVSVRIAPFAVPGPAERSIWVTYFLGARSDPGR